MDKISGDDQERILRAIDWTFDGSEVVRLRKVFLDALTQPLDEAGNCDDKKPGDSIEKGKCPCCHAVWEVVAGETAGKTSTIIMESLYHPYGKVSEMLREAVQHQDEAWIDFEERAMGLLNGLNYNKWPQDKHDRATAKLEMVTRYTQSIYDAALSRLAAPKPEPSGEARKVGNAVVEYLWPDGPGSDPTPDGVRMVIDRALLSTHPSAAPQGQGRCGYDMGGECAVDQDKAHPQPSGLREACTAFEREFSHLVAHRGEPDQKLAQWFSTEEMVELRLYEAALAQADKEAQGSADVCEWSRTEDWDDEHWQGDCGIEYCFIEGGPVENEMAFCPKYGKRLVIEEPKPEEEGK